MTASPYQLSSVNDLGAKRRRFSLARLRAGGLGGGLGVLIVGLGLLAIGLGWNGMAGGGGEVNGVPNLNAQLPWLVSGGILGLALVVFGAALLIVQNARTDRARLESKLDELVVTLQRSAAPAAVAYPSSSVRTTGATAGVYLNGASTYHRPDCRLVDGRDEAQAATAAEISEQGLKPCRVCKPDAVSV